MSRNIYFYKTLKLSDTYETRVYLMFMYFSIILIIYKKKQIKFPQKDYDSFFYYIENNLRELGFGDIAVNKKMKELNKIFYDILLKINSGDDKLSLNRNLIIRYFTEFKDKNHQEYSNFDQKFSNFYHFCFDKDPNFMIKEAINFKI